MGPASGSGLRHLAAGAGWTLCPAAPVAAIAYQSAAASRSVSPNSRKRPPSGRPLLSLRVQTAIGCACSPQGARPRSNVPPPPHGGSGPVFTADCGRSMGLPAPRSNRRPGLFRGHEVANAAKTVVMFRSRPGLCGLAALCPIGPTLQSFAAFKGGTDASRLS